MIDKIQDSSDEAKKLKDMVEKYADCWSQLDQVVDEYTQKFQQEIKILTKEKKRNVKG